MSSIWSLIVIMTLNVSCMTIDVHLFSADGLNVLCDCARFSVSATTEVATHGGRCEKPQRGSQLWRSAVRSERTDHWRHYAHLSHEQFMLTSFHLKPSVISAAAVTFPWPRCLFKHESQETEIKLNLKVSGGPVLHAFKDFKLSISLSVSEKWAAVIMKELFQILKTFKELEAPEMFLGKCGFVLLSWVRVTSSMTQTKQQQCWIMCVQGVCYV